MTLSGMDIERVRAMGFAMQTRADQMRGGMASQLDGLVRQIPEMWSGNDAIRFAQWWAEHRTHLLQVAEDLHGLGQSALNNATEQEKISEGGTSGGHAPSGVSPGGSGGAGDQEQPEPPPAGTGPTAGGIDPTRQSIDSLRDGFRSDWDDSSTFDQWGFYYNPNGNCVSYVAWRMNQLAAEQGLGEEWFHNEKVGEHSLGYAGRLSDADNWSDAVQGKFVVDDNPRPGSVAWWDIGTLDRNYGHVAVVRSVDDATGAVEVEESHFGSVFFQTKTYGGGGGSKPPDGYIHFLPET